MSYADLLAAVEARNIPLATRLIAAGAPSMTAPSMTAPSMAPRNYDIFHTVALSHTDDLLDYYPRALLDVFLAHRQNISQERLNGTFSALISAAGYPEALHSMWKAGARPTADAIYRCCVNNYAEADDIIELLVEWGQDFNMRMPYEGKPTLVDYLIDAGCKAVLNSIQRRLLVNRIAPRLQHAGCVIENKARWDELCLRVVEERKSK